MSVTGRVAGKVAWVTGGASGIGEATCHRLAAEGATVVVADLNAEGASRVAEAINASGGKAVAKHQDVTDEQRWAVIADEVLAEFGQLNVLVNNAGVALTGSVEEASLADFRFVNGVNSEAVFLGMRAAVNAMKAGGGSIINLSSIEGLVGDPLLVAYNASKAAVRMMTKSAALHCAAQGYGIRVNSVHPGYVLTPMVQQGLDNLGDEAEAVRQRLMEHIPMGRMGEPNDIANGILFLASDESSFMTGAELVIDGGYTAH